MQKREKLLAIATGALVLLMTVRWGYVQISTWYESRQRQIASLRAAIGKSETELTRGKAAKSQLAAWEERSLPADVELARFHYGSWLRELVDEAGMTDVDVGSQPPRSRQQVYTWLSFTARGRGSLASLTKLLYSFYRAGHLHQIRRMDIKPLENSDQLAVNLTIEALVLPGATRSDRLSTEVSNRLAHEPLEPYLESIVERNLFEPYVPPQPQPKPRPEPKVVATPKPPPKPSFDLTRFAVVSSITTDRFGDKQVWIQVRTSNQETLKLKVGEAFEIGDLHGTVVSIKGRQVVLATGEQRLLVELGESLASAVSLPPEGI